MKDLRAALPSEAKQAIYEEIVAALARRKEFNIYGELKTFIKLDIRGEPGRVRQMV